VSVAERFIVMGLCSSVKLGINHVQVFGYEYTFRSSI